MPPLSLMIKPVSGACNMRCEYCFYTDVMHNRIEQNLGIMSEDILETLVRRAFIYAEGSVTFAFQGGEPTLAGLHFYEKLVALQRQYNTQGIAVNNALQTNGYALSDDLIALFAQEKFLIGVSLDGTERIHDALRKDAFGAGTYVRVVDTAARLTRQGVEFNILCVVNGLVARAPKEVFDALKPYGYLQFIPCLDAFSGEKRSYALFEDDYAAFLKATFDLYYAAWRENAFVSVRTFDNFVGIIAGHEPENCGMRGQCGRYYLIEGDGGVYPCDFYVLDQWRMGNIAEDSFFRLEKSEIAAHFRDESLPVPDRCRACKWGALCRNGCKRERVGGVQRFCRAYQDFFAYAHPRLREIANR